MTPPPINRFSAFAGDRLVARGDLAAVAIAAHARLSDQPIVLDDATGRTVDLNLQGSAQEVAERFAAVAALRPPAPRGRGRPKLGVTAREVTLLPRHWDWLAAQSGGASAALRRLVDQARRVEGDGAETRAAQERVYRAMTTLCGDRPGYEEAIRALFANDRAALVRLTAAWPANLRDYLRDLWGLE